MQYKTAQHTSSCLKFWIKVNLNFKWSQGKLPLPTEPVYTAEFDPTNYTNKHLWAFASALVGHYFTSWQEGIEQQRNTANEKAWAGCSIVYSSLCWMNNGSPLLDFFWTFFNGRPWASRAPLTSVSALRRNGDEGVCFFFYLFSVAYLPLFGNLRLTGTEEREEKTCSKGSGLESNPGCCNKDSALVHGANAPPTGCQDDCFWMLAEENTDESE